MALRTISLCSGVEGLGLGVDFALEFLFGCPGQPVLLVERELYCASALASRMEEGHLAPCPIWSDLRTAFDGECGAYLARAKAQLMFGGIPCQPWSVAGKQERTADERDLWPHVRQGVEKLAPDALFLENVPGFAVWDGLGRVARDLRGLGYRVAAMLLSASDVGASHGRERLFVMAHRDSGDGSATRINEGGERADGRVLAIGRRSDVADSTSCGTGESGLRQEEARNRGEDARRGSADLADPSDRLVQVEGWGPERRDGARSADPNMADTQSPKWRHDESNRVQGGRQRPSGSVGALEHSPSRNGQIRARPGTERFGETEFGGGGIPLFAPGPSDPRWPGILVLEPGLAPALPLAALRARAEARPQSRFRGVVDELTAQVDLRGHRLRAVGNGVVPLCAATAFVLLHLALTESGRVEEVDAL